MKKLFISVFAISVIFILYWIAQADFPNSGDDITGANTYSFDSDVYSFDNIISSALDPSGLNAVEPGTNMSYIMESELEGSTIDNLKLALFNQAKDYMDSGFAHNNSSAFKHGIYTLPDNINPISFPDGSIEPTISGIASPGKRYGRDFGGPSSRPAGEPQLIETPQLLETPQLPPTPQLPQPSQVSPVPEPTTMLLLGFGLVGLAGIRKKIKK